MKYNTAVAILTLTLAFYIHACSGGGSSSNEKKLQVESWYNSTNDRYLILKSDNTAEVRECSVNEGYRLVNEGYIEGNEITFDDETHDFTISDSMLTVNGVDYVLKDSMPEVCANDAIDVVSFHPESAIAGSETTFEVDYEYRLVSGDEAIVRLGFNDLTNDQISTIETATVYAGNGSGTISATATPQYYDPPGGFKIFLSLGNDLVSLSSHEVDVVVNASSDTTEDDNMNEDGDGDDGSNDFIQIDEPVASYDGYLLHEGEVYAGQTVSLRAHVHPPTESSGLKVLEIQILVGDVTIDAQVPLFFNLENMSFSPISFSNGYGGDGSALDLSYEDQQCPQVSAGASRLTLREGGAVGEQIRGEISVYFDPNSIDCSFNNNNQFWAEFSITRES
jgi:hypothetical protein